jgi:hypothetical protein
MAKALRNWQAENPVADVAIGFVPGVGQLYGLASAAAAYADPDATALDRGLATAGILPLGKAAGAVRKIAVGPKGIEALKDSEKLLRGKWKGGDKIVRQELDDSGAALFRPIPEERQKLEKVLDFPELFHAYPELRNTDIVLAAGRGGEYDPVTSVIRIGRDLPPTKQMGVLKHELTHGVQKSEGYGPGYVGTAFEGTGTRYARDFGEQEARVGQFRDEWPRAVREEIPFVDHQRVEKWRLNKARDAGTTPLRSADMELMKDPEMIRLALKLLRTGK